MADQTKHSDEQKAEGPSRSSAFHDALAAFGKLSPEEQAAFLLETMMSTALGGVKKAVDIFAEAMDEAVNTARQACRDDEEAPTSEEEE